MRESEAVGEEVRERECGGGRGGEREAVGEEVRERCGRAACVCVNKSTQTAVSEPNSESKRARGARARGARGGQKIGRGREEGIKLRTKTIPLTH